MYTTGDFKGVIPLEVGFEEAQPLATFWNLCGFRVPGNEILALDEVQTVLYTRLVITRFLYWSAGLNERQSLPKKAKVRSSTLVALVPKWEWPNQWL